MGCEFEVIFKDDTQYFQSCNSGNIGKWRGVKLLSRAENDHFFRPAHEIDKKSSTTCLTCRRIACKEHLKHICVHCKPLTLIV